MYRRPGTTISILGVLLLSGCGSTPQQPAQRVVQPGAPGQATRVVGIESITPALPHTEADVRFMQRMMIHHEQALLMSRLVPERSGNRDIHLLARRTEVSQNDEMAMMREWLERRGEAVPSLDASAHHHEAMPGMIGIEDLSRLEAARGLEFDQRFLLAMIRHHQGALEMVAELFATPGAVQEEEIFQFASHVEADQRIEIARMQRMYTAMSR